MTLRAIPRSIWALGFVSMLMDISSEMIHALLPVYLMTVLGASATMVGAIEGIAAATFAAGAATALCALGALVVVDRIVLRAGRVRPGP